MTSETKEKRLIQTLKSLPFYNYTEDERKSIIVLTCITAEENGWIDLLQKICDDNPNATLEEVFDLYYSEERFPPLEIVDDEE